MSDFMGVAFFAVFEDGSGGWCDDINGKCLARAADILDRVAKMHKVPTLYEYFSMTRDQAISELLGGDPDDPTSYAADKVPEETWYDSQEGLRTVRILLDHVRNHELPIEHLKDVIDDLEAFERYLADAASRGIRWHLAIDS
jgi:hypothetical protein